MSTDRIKYLSDVLEVVKDRAGIIDTQTETIAKIQSYIGQKYDDICGERNWSWRVFDRSFIISPAVTTGTASISNGFREVTISGLTLTSSYLGRSIRFNEDDEMYRIIGLNVGAGTIILEASYIGDDDASATYEIYNFEFSLPFDCDDLVSVNISGGNEVVFTNPLQFKRLVNSQVNDGSAPYYYCRYATTLNPNSLVPVLEEWVLGYDFLAKNDDSGELGDKISFYPINPTTAYKIDIQYAMNTNGYEAGVVPLIPANDRWALVDYALHFYYVTLGQYQSAQIYLSSAERKLKKMRSEHRHAESRISAVLNGNRYQRTTI